MLEGCCLYILHTLTITVPTLSVSLSIIFFWLKTFLTDSFLIPCKFYHVLPNKTFILQASIATYDQFGLGIALPPIKLTCGHTVCHQCPRSHLCKLHLIRVSNYSLPLSPVASQIREEAKWTLPNQLAEWAAQANDTAVCGCFLVAVGPKVCRIPPSQMRRFKKDFSSWSNCNINYFKGLWSMM